MNTKLSFFNHLAVYQKNLFSVHEIWTDFVKKQQSIWFVSKKVYIGLIQDWETGKLLRPEFIKIFQINNCKDCAGIRLNLLDQASSEGIELDVVIINTIMQKACEKGHHSFSLFLRNGC